MGKLSHYCYYWSWAVSPHYCGLLGHVQIVIVGRRSRFRNTQYAKLNTFLYSLVIHYYVTDNRMLSIRSDVASILVWCGVECWLCSHDLNTLTDDVAR